MVPIRESTHHRGSMTADHIAKADELIEASPERIWQALTDPAAIARYMFGAKVTTNWTVGGSITWEGEWNGQRFRDHGRILKVIPGEELEYTHFTPSSGLPDHPKNYHTVTIHLAREGNATRVRLTQDNHATEEAKAHAERNWRQMLTGLKALAEGRPVPPAAG